MSGTTQKMTMGGHDFRSFRDATIVFLTQTTAEGSIWVLEEGPNHLGWRPSADGRELQLRSFQKNDNISEITGSEHRPTSESNAFWGCARRKRVKMSAGTRRAELAARIKTTCATHLDSHLNQISTVNVRDPLRELKSKTPKPLVIFNAGAWLDARRQRTAPEVLSKESPGSIYFFAWLPVGVDSAKPVRGSVSFI